MTKRSFNENRIDSCCADVCSDCAYQWWVWLVNGTMIRCSIFSWRTFFKLLSNRCLNVSVATILRSGLQQNVRQSSSTLRVLGWCSAVIIICLLRKQHHMDILIPIRFLLHVIPSPPPYPNLHLVPVSEKMKKQWLCLSVYELIFWLPPCESSSFEICN